MTRRTIIRTTYETKQSDLGSEECGRVEVLTGADFSEVRARHRRGETVGPLPYGVQGLEQRGIRLTQHRGGKSETLSKFEQVTRARTGMHWAIPLRAAPTLSGCNAMMTIFEDYGSLTAIAKTKHLLPFSRVPLIVISCWWAEAAMTATARELTRLRRLLEGVDLVVYFSQNQRAIFSDLLDVPVERQLAVTFGVDTDFYAPEAVERDLDVVSVGRDGGRDFGSLIDAAARADFSVTMATSEPALAGLAIPPNITNLGWVDHSTYRNMLRRAKIVVVPTHDVAYPSGQSVVLEAMACGCAVVVSDTPAMSDYATAGANCLVTPVGDSQALRGQIETLLADPQQRERLGQQARTDAISRFTDRDMWGPIFTEGKSRGFW